MSEDQPVISVGMPVYNGEPYLKDAIDSILCQTMADFELIISDNASTDGTEAICREYAKNDERVRYVRNTENVGAARNYNIVFELANGEFFRWANADDLSEPSLHEKCLEALVKNPKAVMSYGKTKIIDGSADFVRLFDDNLDLQQDLASDRFLDFFKRYELTNVIYGLMRADAMRKTNLFGDGSLPGTDVRFVAEMTLQGKFIEIPEALFCRRMHSGAFSSDYEGQGQFWRAQSGAFKMPVSRLYLSYWRSVWQAPMRNWEKFRLSLYIAKWVLLQSPKIAVETFDYARGKVGGQHT